MSKNLSKNAVVWGQEGCQYCVEAKALLEARGFEVEYRKIGEGWTKEQFAAANPGARSVPQIYIGNKLIGAYPHLREYFRHNNVILKDA